MNEQQPQATVVDAPAERPPLAYGRAQLAALVIVQTGNVASIPPQVFAAVTLQSDPNAIVALVGPESDLGSVQDAVVFSQAYALRSMLREAVIELSAFTTGGDRPDMIQDVVNRANAVIEASTPHYVKLDGVKAEDKLAAAREGYDPSQNLDTTGITSEKAMSVDVTDNVGSITAIDGTDTPPAA